MLLRSVLPEGLKARLRPVRDRARRLSTRTADALGRNAGGPLAGLATSQVCTEAQMTSPRFRHWAEELRAAWDPNREDSGVRLHRKLWEWCFILDVLDRAGCLRAGRRGLGFGVGVEPLVSYLAGRGAQVLATDLGPEDAARRGWQATAQYAGSVEGLNGYDLCEPERFNRSVKFRVVNMDEVPDDLRGFDFTWSSCAFEHLGSLEKGMQFILAQMACLKPGGIAVHTTEYNLSSEVHTIKAGGTVIYRRSDVEEMVGRLRAEGHHVVCDFFAGNGPADLHVDNEPYTSVHLKVGLAGYTATSFGLVVTAARRQDLYRLRLQRWLERHGTLPIGIAPPTDPGPADRPFAEDVS